MTDDTLPSQILPRPMRFPVNRAVGGPQPTNTTLAHDGEAEKTAWPDPDFGLLAAIDPTAPTFPADLIGPELPELLADTAAALNVPLSFVATTTLVCAAAALGSRVHVRAGGFWSEPSNLSSCLVGTAASGKSRTNRLVRGLMSPIRDNEAAGWEEKRVAAERDQLVLKKQWSAYEAAVEKALRTQAPLPPAPETRPDSVVVPIRPDIVIEDITPAAIIRRAAASPRGLLAVPDEATKVLASSGSRDMWLQAANAGPYVEDRISRASAGHIECLSICVLTGTQPDRVRGLLGPDVDGLASRFLWDWPSDLPIPKICSDAPDVQKIGGLLFRLRAAGDVAARVAIPVSSDAFTILNAALERWHTQAETVGGHLAGWLGRAGSHALRIALVLGVLDHVAHGRGGLPDEISAAVLDRATTLVEGFYMPMAARVLAAAGQPRSERTALRLFRLLKGRKLHEFNRRALGRANRGLFPDDRDLAVACDELVAAGWLRQVEPPPGTLGRRSSSYVVHPRLI